MAKHIIGLILFSLIVGVSVFVASATNTSNSVDVSKSYRLITVEKRKRKKRRHCRPHRRSLDVSAMQVVFNRDSELLSASFDPIVGKHEYGDIQLHFFAKDNHETRFLKTERVYFGGEGIETSRKCLGSAGSTKIKTFM